MLGGETIADTTRGYRVLETSHPPNYYLPPDDVRDGVLERAEGASFCEWKGRAHYFTVHGGDVVAPDAAWAYDTPSARVRADPRASSRSTPVGWTRASSTASVSSPRPGGFYGGWITTAVVGPFKGGPGSRGW